MQHLTLSFAKISPMTHWKASEVKKYSLMTRLEQREARKCILNNIVALFWASIESLSSPVTITNFLLFEFSFLRHIDIEPF